MATVLKTAPLPFIHPYDMPNEYALVCVGGCMEPLIADGTLIVFDKRREPQRGDIVGVVFTREAAERWQLPGIMKRLAMALPPPDLGAAFEGLIVVDHINPPRRYCIPTSDVFAVHKAVGTAESDGPGRAKFCPAKVEAWS